MDWPLRKTSSLHLGARRALASAVLLGLTACGAVAPGPERPTLPTLRKHGGDPLTAPEVTTVVWAGDEALGADADRLTRAVIAAGPYWGLLAEYGVGPGVALGVRVLPGPAPASLTEAELRLLVDDLVVAGSLPAPTPQTIFSFLPPVSTRVTRDGLIGCASCNGMGGFHGSTARGVAYAVSLRCADAARPPSEALSHELSEAATNPRPELESTTAWAADLGFGEVADLCAASTTTIEGQPVTKLYSSRIAAGAKGDPCLPAGASPFVHVALALDGPITVDASGDGRGFLTLRGYAEDAPGNATPIRYRLTAVGGRLCQEGGGAVTFSMGVGLAPTVTSSLQPGRTADRQVVLTGIKEGGYSIVATFTREGDDTIHLSTIDLPWSR